MTEDPLPASIKRSSGGCERRSSGFTHRSREIERIPCRGRLGDPFTVDKLHQNPTTCHWAPAKFMETRQKLWFSGSFRTSSAFPSAQRDDLFQIDSQHFLLRRVGFSFLILRVFGLCGCIVTTKRESSEKEGLSVPSKGSTQRLRQTILQPQSEATKKPILPSVVFSLQTTEEGLDYLFQTILALLI